jgi:hypothetical protein
MTKAGDAGGARLAARLALSIELGITHRNRFELREVPRGTPQRQRRAGIAALERPRIALRIDRRRRLNFDYVPR